MHAVKREAIKTVLGYLEGLVWDGTPRLDRWLIDCAGAADTAAVRLLSRRMLVAAVRRARDPGCRFDQLPVLVGMQGSGKSEALRILAVMHGWHAVNVFTPHMQGVIGATAGKWLVEMQELRRADSADVKAFLSRSYDEGRMPHERAIRRVPRSFLAVGTTNSPAFLPATGNRRFLPVDIRRFDLGLLREMRDQLWAEAVAVEAGGEPLDLVRVVA